MIFYPFPQTTCAISSLWSYNIYSKRFTLKSTRNYTDFMCGSQQGRMRPEPWQCLVCHVPIGTCVSESSCHPDRSQLWRGACIRSSLPASLFFPFYYSFLMILVVFLSPPALIKTLGPLNCQCETNIFSILCRLSLIPVRDRVWGSLPIAVENRGPECRSVWLHLKFEIVLQIKISSWANFMITLCFYSDTNFK